MVRAWQNIPIKDCGEQLFPFPSTIKCFDPHPYFSLGAPYGKNANPFRLRISALKKLLLAEASLKKSNPELRFSVFDAWRPIEVQEFMINHEISKECNSRGLIFQKKSHEKKIIEVINEVGKFWAPVDNGSKAPPPHSTGGAIDLTLADAKGKPLFMGSEIDAIGPISHPNHFSLKKKPERTSDECTWHERRSLLAKVMIHQGFVQHPNEWWHFSFGDQLWAWANRVEEAFYGVC